MEGRLIRASQAVQLGAEHLQCALGERPTSTSIPSAIFQRMSKSARALASASWTWSSRAVANKLGGTLSLPLSAQ